MRLIDADALAMEIVNTVSEASLKAWETGTHTYIDTLNRLAERQHEIIDMIHDAPTINPDDLRPHGCWEEWWPGISIIMTGEEMLYRCSECDAKWGNVEGYRYCPYCGAKMDGKENEDVCTTCRFYPLSSCDGKPCTACGHGNPCYQRKENDDA